MRPGTPGAGLGRLRQLAHTPCPGWQAHREGRSERFGGLTLRIFVATWGAAATLIVVAIGLGQRSFTSVALGLMLVMLVPTLAMFRWLGLPESTRASTRRGAYALTIVAAVAALVGLYVVFGRPGALIPIAVTAALITWRVRRQLAAPDALCAFALGAVASIAGLGAEWIGTDTVMWAVLQLPLTAFGLLAGWGILRGGDLAHTPASTALLVSEGPGAAARAALFGVVIAVPWALFNVAAGGTARDTWVHAPWQILAAAQPAIAEEAWARVFLVALLYVALRWAASSRVALVGAIVVAGYWFAWLHVHDLTIGALVNAIVAGTLFSLPLTLLWLRRGLEAAIGFHFAVDATRFAFAYLINAGLV